jgi:hypothetical protein
MSTLLRQWTTGMAGGQSWQSYWTQRSDFWLKEDTRSGLTLPNAITPAVNDASILLPLFSSVRTSSTNGYYFDSGIIPSASTIMVFKGRVNTLPSLNTYGAMGEFDDAQGYFVFGASGYTGKWYMAWGTGDNSGSEDADTDYHVFIAYNKKLWVVDISTPLTDASILNVIATETPKVTVTGTFTGTPSRSLGINACKYTNVLYASYDCVECYIGTVSGTITWARKYIFNDLFFAYDLLDASNSVALQNSGGGATVAPTKIYSQYGSDYCLNNGHTLLRKNATDKYSSVPYLLAGTPNHTVANPTGYETVNDFAGDSGNINYADCEIQHSLAFFDRSDTTIWGASARLGYYDSTSATTKKRWHISEHNYNKIQGWANTGYNQFFVKTSSNSMDYYAWTKIKEIILCTANQSASEINKALSYCGDLATWNYPYWNKLTFPASDIQKTLNQFDISTGQTQAVTELSLLYDTVENFAGAILTDKGYIYVMPFIYDGILKIDTNTDILSIVLAGSFGVGVHKYGTACMGENGFIYAPPYNATDFLKFDPTTEAFTKFSTNAVAGAYYSCQRYGKYIYVAPSQATKFLKIDTTDDSVAEIGDALSVSAPDGLFNGLVLAPNGFIYAIPNKHDHIIKINPADDSMTEIGSFDRAIFKWWSGVCTKEGIIYCAPYNDARIMKIDTNTDTVSYLACNAITNNENFAMVVLGANGKIYMIPCAYEFIMEIDPSDDSITYFESEPVIKPQFKYGTATLAKNGQIYCWGATKTIKFLSSYTLDKNMVMSRIVNKY